MANEPIIENKSYKVSGEKLIKLYDYMASLYRDMDVLHTCLRDMVTVSRNMAEREKAMMGWPQFPFDLAAEQLDTQK